MREELETRLGNDFPFMKRTLCDKCLSKHLQKREYRKAEQKIQIQELKAKRKQKQQ